MKDFLVHASYLVGAALFVIGLKRLSRVRSARRGNQVAAIGMTLAVVATLVAMDTVGWVWVVCGLVLGGLIGAVLATRVEMTGMPELVAFFNGMGGAASTVVALSFYTGVRGSFDGDIELSRLISGETFVSILLSLLIGTVTLTGSLVAYGKLSGKIPGKPIVLPQRHAINLVIFVLLVALGCLAGYSTDGFLATTALLALVTILAGILGVMLVIPIGGADMPVVISLLNSYSGVAAAMTGFVLIESGNKGALMLIVCGALVGAAGLILTNLMCKAMNRSLVNVLAGGFGDTGGGGDSGEYENVKSFSAEEAAMLLDGAELVIVVPGYGLAVAQAQHALAELDHILTERGATVKYAIHPVAGRMPGHMNVLLAEANVPYEKLYDLDDINNEFKNAQVAIVVGANDVVNPAAINDPKSPIAGMPILKVHEAQNVIVIKRSLSPGYAGIKNELFEYPNTMMLFDDAKHALEEMARELKEL